MTSNLFSVKLLKESLQLSLTQLDLFRLDW